MTHDQALDLALLTYVKEAPNFVVPRHALEAAILAYLKARG